MATATGYRDGVKVAMDGPAGVGKSTLSRRLAVEIGVPRLDTGSMYRAITWACIRGRYDPANERLCTMLADLSILELEDGEVVRVDGEDVRAAIRSPEVTAAVSAVSAHYGVREALSGQQRRYALEHGVVMDGRDIGTIVLPDADVKIFLGATDEVRAARRLAELEAAAGESGRALDVAAVLADVRRRDRFDSTRQLSPLRPAPDAVHIDNSSADLTVALKEILALVPRT